MRVLETPRLRFRGAEKWPRQCAAFYGLLLLLASAASPHRHLNAIEDILSDGPSDSGTVVLQPTGGPDPWLSTRIEIDDDPCLACFQHDYASAASFLFAVLHEFRSIALSVSPVDLPVPQPLPDSPASRSPPASAQLT